MKKHFFDRIEGPIVILAIHLCGTLSLKAIDMFNKNEKVSFFALKPCCLPNMIHAKRDETFAIGNHEFPARDVCSHGRFKKNKWKGPPRWYLKEKFDTWAENLYLGIDTTDHESIISSQTNEVEISTPDDKGRKVKQNIGTFTICIDFLTNFISWNVFYCKLVNSSFKTFFSIFS